MKTVTSFLILTFISLINVQAQSHSHDDHLGKLLGHYFKMKDALVADDFESSKSALALFSEEVSTNSEMNNHPEHAQKHGNHHGMMVAAVKTATETESLEQLRNTFDEITTELLTAIENQGYTDGTLYVQFCPMTNDGNGAKWISKEENIMNPYYGSMMLKCGSTIETIE